MQKSGKTSKIDFYKFISPKGQKSDDDSEGTVAANIISTKIVKTNNEIGKTLNGIGEVLQDISKSLAVNNAMAMERDKQLTEAVTESSAPKNTQPVAEKKSGITDFLAPVVGSFFEGLANLASYFFKTFVARAILEWLSDEENFENLTNIVDGLVTIGTFIFNFFKGTVGGILDGISKMWDPEATWWEKLAGFGQFFISLGGLLLGLRWLKNPVKLVKDFIWVLKTLYTNLIKGKRRMKGRGRFGGLITTAVVVGGAGLLINATNNANAEDTTEVTEDTKNTVPVGDTGSKKYAIMSYGTDKHKDPEKAAEYVTEQITKAKEMGYNTVFIPPSSQGDKFAEVNEATTNAAQAAGAIIENASFDPDKGYEKMIPSSMKAIQSKYNGAAVFGDKTARLADKPNRVGGANTLPKLEEKAAGGWISGPQSGYPVSLDGGSSVSFIGHGTEYVAQRAGGGFVVPFDTPATRKNPGLTGQRIGEASRGGFKLGGMLPGFDIGGKLSSMLPQLPQFAAGGKITDVQKKALNVLAKYESGAAGYDAVNQIGTKGGRGVEGFSGDFKKMKQHGGKPLTTMTIGEVKALQHDDKSMSDSQWINAGKLHATGRYQFIGNTLPGVASRAGLSDSDLYNEHNQDLMALQLMRERGISPWVGPSDKATAAERAIVAQAAGMPLEGYVGQAGDSAGVPDYADEQTASESTAQTPEQLLNTALGNLTKGIEEVRGVMHGDSVTDVTESTADAKDQAEKDEVKKTEDQMAAATNIATAASKDSAAKAITTAAGSGGGQKTIVVPTEEKSGLLSFLPNLGLFGASS